jgi:hypothetical protein
MFSISLRTVKFYNLNEIDLISPMNLKSMELHAEFTEYIVCKVGKHGSVVG